MCENKKWGTLPIDQTKPWKINSLNLEVNSPLKKQIAQQFNNLLSSNHLKSEFKDNKSLESAKIIDIEIKLKGTALWESSKVLPNEPQNSGELVSKMPMINKAKALERVIFVHCLFL